MKTVKLLLSAFIIITVSISQDINLQLAGAEASNFLLLQNTSTDTLMKIQGNGIFRFGKGATTEQFNFSSSGTGFFNVGGLYTSEDDGCLDINLFAHHGISRGNDGGKVFLKGGTGGTIGEIGDGAEVNVFGGTIHHGGNLEITGGFGSNSVTKGGNITVTGGFAGYEGGTITLRGGNQSGVENNGPASLTVQGAGVNDFFDGGDVIICTGKSDGSPAAEPGNFIINIGASYGGNPEGMLILNGSGTYSGTWTNVSDSVFKKDITSLGNVSDKVGKLSAKYFFWKKEKYPERSFSRERQIGLIAQEVKDYFPELVKEDANGYLSVDYAKLSVVLISAFREQQNFINEQEHRLSETERKINSLTEILTGLLQTDYANK